ncbi:MAG TPA: TRAP transporter small permease [Desulfosporosinus sp.]|nr:TRAP transporter small permease [Desulfosporosinus sp.]
MGANNAKRIKLITKKANQVLEAIEVGSLVGAVIVIAVAWIVNVVARQFHKSIFFVEEISLICLIIITFIGASYGVRRARHVRMSALFEAMSPKIQKIMIIFTAFAGAVITFLMASYAWDYMMVARFRGQLTPALRIPYWKIWCIVPVGFFLMGVEYVRTVIRNIVEKDVWLSPEQKSEYED